MPHIHIGYSPFKACAAAGLVFGFALIMVLTSLSNLSLWIAGAIPFVAIATFLGLAITVKVLTGVERLTHYHHQVTIISVVTFLVLLLHQPILPYLDILLLGIGMFTVCGRIGCLMAGCCHGRPHHWGICYKPEHAEEGFPSYLVGVRLLPVQAMESIWVFMIVVSGTLLVLTGAPAGAALAWYIVAYGLGRFMLEFLRGDPERPYFWGYSEAQWTSIILVTGVVAAEMAGSLLFSWLHVGVAAILVITLLTVILFRRLDEKATHKLLHPRHIKEIAEAIGILPVSKPTDVRVACTTLDICVSASMIETDKQIVHLYTLSSGQGTLKKEAAHILARLIKQLTHYPVTGTMVEGENGLFHLFLPHVIQK
jgi:hypothetical protein